MAFPATLPVWLLWVQALSVPAVATAGVVIAFQQMSIARTRLQHDLFDRRIDVYRVIRGTLANIAVEGEITQDGLSNLLTAISVVPFLFPRKFSARMQDVGRRITDLFYVQSSLKELTDRPTHVKSRDKLLDQEAVCKTWLSDRLKVLPRMFEPHLRIGPT